MTSWARRTGATFGRIAAWVGVGVVVSPLLPLACAAESAGRAGLELREAPVVAATPTATVSPPAGPAPAEGSSAPAVTLVGRFDQRDPNEPRCAWPGCRIVARFEGTQASVSLDETLRDQGPSEWDVAVDGVERGSIALVAGARRYELASGLAGGAHTIELTKRNEAQTGLTGFGGFDFGAGGRLLAPPPRSTRRIEIIGDSSAAGLGILPVTPEACNGPEHAARYQDFRLTFGARLGAIFSADVHGTTYSGKGISQNYVANDRETLADVYDRVDPLDGTTTYDPARFVPDVIVVMVGEADFAAGAPDVTPASLASFIDAYQRFVTRLRQRSAKAHLFLVVSPVLRDDGDPHEPRTNVLVGTQAAADALAARGDARVHFLAPAPAAPSEYAGCPGAPNAQLHERVAGELAGEIRKTVGWQ